MVSITKPTRVTDMNLNQANYKKLLKIVPMLKEMTSATTPLASSGATPLMSLCQYGGHPVGHTVADPSMIIAVHMTREIVETLKVVTENLL